ncbi:MAG: alpha/beta hydrolase [Verrucomicrobia bacterium]|nr:alpha/beta hydrolase [Verrucomicrobiota bacterium]
METQYVVTNGVRTFVQVAGTGAPSVFIHGVLLNSALWLPQLEHFAAAHLCISYDLRGHGRTGSTSEKAYTTRLFAEDLRGLLDSLGLEQVTLCGLSLGGMIAQTFAELHAHRVGRLILCDTVCSTFAGTIDMLLNAVLGVVTPPAVRALGAGYFCVLDDWIGRLSGEVGWISQTALGRAYASQALTNVPADEMIKVYRAVLAFRGARLSRFSAPALLINGAGDSPLILRQARTLQRELPLAEYHLIPNASHLANLDNPEEFNRILDRFLTQTALEPNAPDADAFQTTITEEPGDAPGWAA